MFGNKSLPSRIYSYGGDDPIEHADLVERQMLLAHRYKNTMIEIERKRRTQVEELLKQMSPELSQVENDLGLAKGRVEAALAVLKTVRAKARRNVQPPALVSDVKAAKAERQELQKRRKGLRDTLFADPSWKEKSKSIEDEAAAANKRARADCKLSSGTYLFVEGSMSKIRHGAPPKFKHWDGTGHLAVQVQGGLSPEEAMACEDSRVRLEVKPEGVWVPGRNRPKKLGTAILSMLVGTEKKGHPVLARIPFVLHRPLPSHTQIKWVHLIKRRIGTHAEWFVQFILASAFGWAKEDAAKSGAVGIDVGWRMRPDGSMRVACWKGDDGKHEELTLPARWLSGMKKTRDIQSIRDRNLDTVKAALLGHFKTLKNVPDWLIEAQKTLPAWKSQGRLAALTIHWRDARFEGDAAAFEMLEAWRKRDKHLYEYESNLRHKLIGQRADLYRNFAARIRRMYRTVVIESLRLNEFHARPGPEEEQVPAAIKEHTRDACLHSFIGCLKNGVANLVAAPAQNTTRKCSGCGSLEDWDRRILEHTCSNCGLKLDQDLTAAINLLNYYLNLPPVPAVGQEDPPKEGGAPKDGKPADGTEPGDAPSSSSDLVA
jgi:hypothetical protein